VAGDVLVPDVELDYEIFRGFAFDPNADLLLALQAMARWGDE
jgi:hypothetical protein